MKCLTLTLLGDLQKDEKDTRYARGYLNRVQSVFEDKPESYEEFLGLLHAFSETKESVVKVKRPQEQNQCMELSNFKSSLLLSSFEFLFHR